jgi:hypothetical protein
MFHLDVKKVDRGVAQRGRWLPAMDAGVGAGWDAGRRVWGLHLDATSLPGTRPSVNSMLSSIFNSKYQ